MGGRSGGGERRGLFGGGKGKGLLIIKAKFWKGEGEGNSRESDRLTSLMCIHISSFGDLF